MKTSPGSKSQTETPAHRVHGLSQLELDFRQQSLANLRPVAPAAPTAPAAPAAKWFDPEDPWYGACSCGLYGDEPSSFDFVCAQHPERTL